MRAAVIVHERLGRWYRQLRPRLSDSPARWFETRSADDLDAILEGVAFPVVLVDLSRQPLEGLAALSAITTRAPGARTLVLDPDAFVEARDLARELGATHVLTGFAPPPLVADLLLRWIDLAGRQAESAGWSRTTFPETATDPWSWLADYLGEPWRPADAGSIPPRGARPMARTRTPHDLMLPLTMSTEDND